MWPEIISAGVAFVALAIEHVWVQRRVRGLERRTQFKDEVEIPSESFEKQISDLIVDLEDWGLERGAPDEVLLRRQWIKLSRDLNRLVVKIASGSSFQPRAGWAVIDTEESDEAMQCLSAKFRVVTSESARQALERLGAKLSTCLKEARPT
jgi:hypothetical protein